MAAGRRVVIRDDRRILLIAVGAGLALGVLTQLGQRLLPDAVEPVANAISPWLAVAFFVGSRTRTPRVAALCGWIALVLALVAYYAMVWLQLGYGASSSSLVLWTVAALAGGVVFGPAGWASRHANPPAAAAATGLLAAAFIAEAVYLNVVLQPEAKPATVIFAAVGLLIPLVLGTSARNRLLAYLAIVPALVLATAGYVALLVLGLVGLAGT